MTLRYALPVALAALCAPALLVPAASAQVTVTWTPRADLNATLPAGIRVFETATPIRRSGFDDPFRAWLVRADTNRATWAFGARLAPSGLQPLASFAPVGVLVAMNGGYFGGSASVSLVAEAGAIKSQNIGSVSRPAGTYYPTRSAFGQLNDGRLDVAWIYHVAGTIYQYPQPSPNTQAAPQPQPTASFPAGATVWPVRDGIGGGPVLVEAGAKRITFTEEAFFGSGIATSPTDGLANRTAIGVTSGGEILMLVAEGRSERSQGATLSELADLFLQLGAREAMNLDGGGSSQLRVGQTVLTSGDSRSLASAVVLGPKATPPPASETYDFDADPSKPATYGERGSWIESSNTPFHATTKSRLNAADAAGDRGTFRLTGIPAGTYDVSGWWIPSGNRATATPFTIYQNGAPTTVRVNQADASTLGKWNPIGRFRLAATDSVTISDDATPSGSFVVADGLRLTRIATAAAAPDRMGTATLRVYPNPTRGSATVEVTAVEGTMSERGATGEVIDLLGRRVATFAVPAGGGLVPVPVDGMAAGVYVVRVGEARARLVVR